MPGRYLRYWTGIGWEQGGPRRKKKVGQQSGGEHVLLNGLPEESIAVSKGFSQIMTSEQLGMFQKNKKNKKDFKKSEARIWTVELSGTLCLLFFSSRIF